MAAAEATGPNGGASPDRGGVTRILGEVSGGDREAVDRLLPLVYDELRALAQAALGRERPGHTLEATALVHEAFLKLVDQRAVQWQGRAHFFAIAAQAIRRILVDHARGKKRAKRGGGHERVALDEVAAVSDDGEVGVLELDDALRKLAGLSERQSRIVELRFFAGLEMKEIAEVLGVSLRTVEGDWAMARAWLAREMRSER